MDCNEARPLLDAATDRELSAADAQRVEQHLAACAECRREAQALRVLSETTRASQYFHAPEALRARLTAALSAVEAPTHRDRHNQHNQHDQRESTNAVEAPASPPSKIGDSSMGDTHAKKPGRGRFGWVWSAWPASRGARTSSQRPSSVLGWPAAIAVAAIALAASLVLVSHRPSPAGSPLVDDLVASHVRAQLSGHDIDVVSSDQHTVKPWFNGRLDYAPPVEDLAEDGFALAGGRLDYVDHRRVAVLVYRYRKHIIDVYVMPATGSGARAPTALTSDGYALASWRARGMIWWAVSDAEPAVLAQLQTALNNRLDRAQAGALQ